MCVTGIVGAATGLIGASSASSAADAQAQASQDQIDLSREIYYDQKETLAPYRGNDLAIQALMYENGLAAAPMIGASTPQVTRTQTSPGKSFDEANPFGEWVDNPGRGGFERKKALAAWEAGGGGRPTYEYSVNGQVFADEASAQAYADANTTGGTEYGGFQETPGYAFRLQEGQDAVQASVGARHGLNSGATLSALSEYNQDYASNEYNNYYNRLASLAAGNQSAATGQVAASGEYVTNANNALANLGNAQAAGSIGVGNAITSGINNGVGLWAYGQQNGWA